MFPIIGFFVCVSVCAFPLPPSLIGPITGAPVTRILTKKKLHQNSNVSPHPPPHQTSRNASDLHLRPRDVVPLPHPLLLLLLLLDYHIIINTLQPGGITLSLKFKFEPTKENRLRLPLLGLSKTLYPSNI